MNFNFMPSLKHIALVKVTTELWNLYDIRDLVARSSTGYYDYAGIFKECQVIEHKLMEMVLELPLPELLKKEILHSIRPIGFEMYKWKTYLRSLDILPSAEECTKILCVPCWTPQGKVDRKKTAEALIKDGNLSITKRYVLACNFCLEDDVKELWNSLPEKKKIAFYDKGRSRFSKIHHRLIVLWTYDIKGEISKLNGVFKDNARREISAYLCAFEKAVFDGNKTATEYFLQKLTPLERESAFLAYTEYVRRRDHRGPLDADVLCFLLSQMNEEQQVKVFESDPFQTLSCLLDWPWQSFFMNAANRMWDFLSEHDYVSIIRNIFTMIRIGFKNCNYRKLFRNFWEQGPSTCKKYFIGICASDGFLLQVLFEYEDKENIRLILKDANVKEKEEILFNFISKNICWRAISVGDKWDLLKLFVQECLSSEDMMIKFKEEFKRHIEYPSRQRSDIEKITEFFQILDDHIHKNSKKRDVEEGSSSPSKRLKQLVNG